MLPGAMELDIEGEIIALTLENLTEKEFLILWLFLTAVGEIGEA